MERRLKMSHIVKIAAENIGRVTKDMKCVRCGHVPRPSYYMICKENGHLLCSQCSWPPLEWLEDAPNLEPRKPSCCDPENLEKGSEMALDNFLTGLHFECRYRKRGCRFRANVKDWFDHVDECKYSIILPCYFYKCQEKLPGVLDTLRHYILTHGATELPFGHDLDVIYDESENAPKRRLGAFKEKGEYFLFSGEIVRDQLHIWMWDLKRVDQDLKEYDKRYCVKLLPTGKDGEITYEGIFHPITRSCESIISSSDCLSIPVSHLKKKHLHKLVNYVDLVVWTVTVTFVEKNISTQEEESDFMKELQSLRGGDEW